MEYRDQMFQIVLANYPFPLIREAFIAHVKRNASLPTPSCIVNLIEPPEPIPDWAAYVGIKGKLKSNTYVTDREREYLRWCEQRAMSRPEEWKDKIAQFEQKMMVE